MKYELIGNNNIFDPIEAIFKNRGIEDYKSFVNLKEDVTNDFKLLSNIEKAVRILAKHLTANNDIFIQTDEDCDGYLSAAMLYNYITRLKSTSSLHWRVHNKKMHGILPNSIPANIDLVIIPDASSGEYEKHKELKNRGKDIIILDHHEVEKESEYAVVVNNQLSPNFPNKEFSACGIVYKFCQALDKHYKVDYADDYLDLVAIGNIADSMDTKELETRYYIQQGLKQIENPLIKAIVDHNKYNLQGKVTVKDVGFTIAPTINATARIGTVREREDLFRALTYQKNKITIEPKENEELYEAVARTLANTRGRQNTLREKGEKATLKRIEDKNLNDNKIIVVDGTDIVESSIGGVVAIKIVEKFKKPTLIIRRSKEDNNIFTGSARGYDESELTDLKQFLNDTNKFIFCEGHPQAHGLKIEASNLVPMVELANERLKDIELGVSKYLVDFIITGKTDSSSLIDQIDHYNDIWGKGVEEPLLAFESIEIERRNIKVIGQNKNTIKFSYNGIEYIKFRANDVDKSILTDGSANEIIIINVVGCASINEWRGRKTGQIIIEDYEVTGTKERKLAF